VVCGQLIKGMPPPIRWTKESVMTLRNASDLFLRRSADRFESRRHLWLTIIGLCYLLLALQRSFRPLWFDELITYNVASLPGVRSIWKSLTQGADLNPPLFHVATWAAARVFGLTELGLRIPGIVGFFVLCWSLYAFVARTTGVCYGFAAMLLPMTTGAFRFASEARAYGLLLGFCGLAVVFWQRAGEGSKRTVFLVCLSATLTAALLTHCYAVLVLVPFGIAQIVEDWQQRKVDWKAWVCLTIPLSACITYLPLIAAAKPYAVTSPVFRPSLIVLLGFYEFLLIPALVPLIAGAALVVIARKRQNQVPSEGTVAWRTGEVALAVGFLLVPVFAFLLAEFFTRIFMPRYGLTAVIGLAILLPRIAAASTGYSRPLAAALSLLLGGWLIASDIGRMVASVNSPPPPVAVSLDRNVDLPLVISSGLIYYEMNHYASPDIASRMWYLTDEETALRVTGTDVFDKGFPALDRLFPLRAKLSDYRTFLSAHPRFLVYGYAHYENDWLVSRLKQEGARLNYLGQRPEEFGRAVLYEVQMPELQESSAR
jgi:hypothetical protein